MIQIMKHLLVVIMNQSKDMHFLTIVICLALEPVTIAQKSEMKKIINVFIANKTMNLKKK